MNIESFTENFLTIKQVVNIVGKARTTILFYIGNGTIKNCAKIGRIWYIPKTEIEQIKLNLAKK